MKSDKDILNYWFEKNDLSDASRELYTIAMNQYSKINKKTIGELYEEADKEEGQNIRLSKREYSFYAIKFKKIAGSILTEAGVNPKTLVSTYARGAHLGGTVAIGDVVDINLQTEIEGLYVADASVFPEVPGAPPVLTIIALAKDLPNIW